MKASTRAAAERRRRFPAGPLRIEVGPGLAPLPCYPRALPHPAGRYKHIEYLGQTVRCYGLRPRYATANLPVQRFVDQSEKWSARFPERAFWYKKHLDARGRYVRLRGFDRPEVKWKPSLTAKRIAQEVGLLGADLTVPYRSDVFGVQCPNESANPGPTYCAMGYRTKSEAWKKAQEVAYQVLYALDNNPVNAGTVACGLGGREKDGDYRDDQLLGESPARLVLMPDSHENVVGALFVKPVMEALKAVRGPIVIGHSWQYGGAERLGSLMRGDESYLCMDMSGFDERVYRWAVDMAFDVVALAYKATTRDGHRRLARALQWCKEQFLAPLVVTPEGYVYRKKGGTTSGSVWTTVINSLVNYIYINEGLIATLGRRGGRFRMWVLGDDSVIGINGEHTLPANFLQRYYYILERKMGLRVNRSKSYWTRSFFHIPGSPDKGVQFLGKRWLENYWPVRDLEDAVRDALVTGVEVREVSEAMTICLGLLVDNPFDPEFFWFIEDFFRWGAQQPLRHPKLTGVSLADYHWSADQLYHAYGQAQSLYASAARTLGTSLDHFKPSRGEAVVRHGGGLLKIKTRLLHPNDLLVLLGLRERVPIHVVIEKAVTTGAARAVRVGRAPRVRRPSREDLQLSVSEFAARRRKTWLRRVAGWVSDLGHEVERVAGQIEDKVWPGG